MAEIALNDNETSIMLEIILDHVRTHHNNLSVDFSVDYDGSYIFWKGGYKISLSDSLIVHIYLGDDSAIIFPSVGNEPIVREILSIVSKVYTDQESNRKKNFLKNFGVIG